jgi:hypothetical protein
MNKLMKLLSSAAEGLQSQTLRCTQHDSVAMLCGPIQCGDEAFATSLSRAEVVGDSLAALSPQRQAGTR